MPSSETSVAAEASGRQEQLQCSWLRLYDTRRKVFGSVTDEVAGLFSVYLILPAALGPGVYSASNRNEC
jgi:hypothetical protein